MKQNYNFIKRMLLVVTVGILSTCLYGQTTISDGTGLAAISGNLSGSYILTADITLTSDWTPIVGFTGTLDGNGHTISGLRVNQSTIAQRGLFSTSTGATIRKLGIESAYVSLDRSVPELSLG